MGLWCGYGDIRTNTVRREQGRVIVAVEVPADAEVTKTQADLAEIGRATSRPRPATLEERRIVAASLNVGGGKAVK